MSVDIGLSIKLYIIDANPMAKDLPELEGFKKVFINPRIIDKNTGTQSFEEGWLSIPGINEYVPRADELRMTYYDENFEFHDVSYTGFQAVVVQHEYDHLDGILFTDKIAPLRKRFIKSKLAAISKGKSKVHYKTKTAWIWISDSYNSRPSLCL